jgi:tRNA1(Val) A37 N6-methylase TrmN6
MAEFETTTDGFLDGKLKIRQPRKGFRAGSDAVLLAAAIEAEGKVTVLDVGCGVGTAGFCLLHRLPGAKVWGLELQPELAALAIENAVVNGFSKTVQIYQADIGDRQALQKMLGPNNKPFLEAGFDHVITNPPYYEKGRANAAHTLNKTLAHIEGDVDLAGWLQFCVARTKSKGNVTVIHRADRLAEILTTLSLGCGNISVLPLWPDEKTPAKRIVVQAVKGGNGPLVMQRGLVLHELDGVHSKQAEEILRCGASLNDILRRNYL